MTTNATWQCSASKLPTNKSNRPPPPFRKPSSPILWPTYVALNFNYIVPNLVVTLFPQSTTETSSNNEKPANNGGNASVEIPPVGALKRLDVRRFGTAPYRTKIPPRHMPGNERWNDVEKVLFFIFIFDF